MNKMKIIPVCIFLMLSFTVLSVAVPEAELGKWWKNSEIVKGLNLSNAQIGQIEQDYLNHRAELADLMKTLNTLEDLLKSAMEAESVDETLILQHAEAVADARKNLEMARTRMMVSIRKRLSKEQWTKLKGMQVLSGTPVIVSGNSVIMSDKIDLSNTAGGEKVYVAEDPDIKKPVVIYMPIPPYTEEAKEAKVEGLVILQVIVRKDGSVDALKVLRGVGYGLDESAIRTIAKEWKFKPGMLKEVPVDVLVTIEVSFRLY